MATKAEIKLFARLTAAEVLIQHLLWMVASSGPRPIQTLQGYRHRVLEEASESTFPNADPATSDLWAQEYREALDALLSKAVARAQGSR